MEVIYMYMNNKYYEKFEVIVSYTYMYLLLYLNQ